MARAACAQRSGSVRRGRGAELQRAEVAGPSPARPPTRLHAASPRCARSLATRDGAAPEMAPLPNRAIRRAGTRWCACRGHDHPLDATVGSAIRKERPGADALEPGPLRFLWRRTEVTARISGRSSLTANGARHARDASREPDRMSQRPRRAEHQPSDFDARDQPLERNAAPPPPF
jgi:hypothetical protein